MNREQNMENFFNFFAKLYKQNPNVPFDKGTVYTYFENYGVPLNEKGRSIKHCFNSWINHFNKKNLQVFHSPLQERFLQFHNGRGASRDHVKIYLTFGPNDIEECVKIIFDYIDKNNFTTLSKVSDIVRSDAVVLRMSNIEDAKKVIEFVNTNQTLVSKARKVNPFLMNAGIAGVANDRKLSYNSVLTGLIADYFNECKDYNKASLDDFKIFVGRYYNDIFVNATSLEKFVSSSNFQSDLPRFSSVGDCLNNYNQVFRGIMINLEQNMNLNDYFNHVSSCQDEKKYFEKSNYYDELYNTVKNERIERENQNKNINKKQLFDEYITYAGQKFGITNVMRYIESYVKGNQCAISRDNNFRDLFIENITPKDIYHITNNNINNYVDTYLGVTQPRDRLYELYTEAIYETFIKYGYKQAFYAVFNSFNGNFSAITNGKNNYRSELGKYDINEVNDFLYRLANAYQGKDWNSVISQMTSNIINAHDSVLTH